MKYSSATFLFEQQPSVSTSSSVPTSSFVSASACVGLMTSVSFYLQAAGGGGELPD